MDAVTRADEQDATDVADFSQWVAPTLPAMTLLARRLAPHADADDVVQDALVRAWRKRAQFDPTRGTPTTWLLAITADRARAVRRTRLRRLRLIDESSALPEVAVDGATADVDLERAIAQLGERQQLAVHLHYYVGLTTADAAAVMGCAPGTVKSTLFDARTRLRALLGDDDDR